MNKEMQSNGELVPAVPRHGSGLAAESKDLLHVVSGRRAESPKGGAATNLTPMSILRALRRRQMLALGVAFLLTGIAGPAAWFLLPPAKFKAQARLQLASQAPKVLFKTVETDNITNSEDYRRYQNTQQTLVLSQFVINAALLDKNLQNFRMIRAQREPIRWIKDNLQVDFVKDSEVMEISMSGEEPVEIAGIVNAITKAYIDEVVNVDTKKRADRHNKLMEYKKKRAEILKEKKDTLRKLAESVGSNDRQTLALKQQIGDEHLAYLRKELLEVQSRIRKADALIKTQVPKDEAETDTAATTYTEADIAAVIDENPTVAALIDQLADEEAELNKHEAWVRSISRVSDPSVKRLRTNVAATRNLLKKKRAAMRPFAIRQLQEEQTDVQETADRDDQRELAMHRDLERRLNDEIKVLTDGSQSLNMKSLDLQSNQEEIAEMQETVSKVGSEIEALNLELEAPPRVRKIEDAEVPLTRDQRKRFALLGLTIFGSFFGGLFGVAFLELLSHKVDTAEEVPTELGLRVVGTLPMVRGTAGRGELSTGRRREKDAYLVNLMLESIDSTRTMVVHAARTGSHRVLMIASATGGEGKTSLASHLATSLARSGLRTLLIDADLRNPSIHRLYDLPVGPGLSEVLRGDCPWREAIGATAVEDLNVLTAGICDRQAIRALSQGAIDPIFQELREQFDFVIVDSSPILPVTDASIIAQCADAALFSIFRDVSRKTLLSDALQRLRCLGVPVLGAVVTGFSEGLYGNTYHSEPYYASLPDLAADSSDPTP